MDKELTVKLVKAMQAGDQAAVGQLYESCYQDIYYFILKTVKEKELAEDLTQETFIKIIEDIHQLQEPEAFVGWSRQVAYYRCTAYFRKHKELLADENEDGSTVFDTIAEENEEFIPHEALDKEDLKKTILAMINQLPQEQRMALIMRYYEELPVAQIAQIQGVSEGTVKSRLNYGRNAVRKSVEAYEKKNGIKLHSIAILPLLLWLFRRQKAAKTAYTLAAKVGGSAAGAATGSVGGGVAAQAGAAAASKGFFASVGAKVLAAVLAVAVVGGGVAAAIAFGGQDDSGARSNKARKVPRAEKPAYTEPVYTENTELKNTLNELWSQGEILHTRIETLVFTDRPVPEGAEVEDCSAAGDNSVLVWIEDNTMYVTTADGGTLYAPENSSYLFSGGYGDGKESTLKNIVFDNFDTSRVRYMYNMFRYCESLESLDLSGWDVSNVVDMYEMFAHCDRLQTVEVSNWDVSNVTDMHNMFYYCYQLRTLDVSNWEVSNVTDMDSMFAYCEALEYLDVSKWDVSNVTRMGALFLMCNKLNNLDVSKWDVSNVTSMGCLFASCWELEALDVSNWDVSNVTSMGSMFSGCATLGALDVSNWDVSKVTDMHDMFSSCYRLRTLDLSNWSAAANVKKENMFRDCELLPESVKAFEFA